MFKYRVKDLWVLCTCDGCNTRRYVEPHGTTAQCKKCNAETEHTPVEV